MLVLNSGVKRMNNDSPCIPFNSLCFPCKETSFSPVMLTKGTIQPIFISAIKSDSPSNLWELVTGRFAYAGKDVLDLIIWISTQVLCVPRVDTSPCNLNFCTDVLEDVLYKMVIRTEIRNEDLYRKE